MYRDCGVFQLTGFDLWRNLWTADNKEQVCGPIYKSLLLPDRHYPAHSSIKVTGWFLIGIFCYVILQHNICVLLKLKVAFCNTRGICWTNKSHHHLIPIVIGDVQLLVFSYPCPDSSFYQFKHNIFQTSYFIISVFLAIHSQFRLIAATDVY